MILKFCSVVALARKSTFLRHSVGQFRKCSEFKKKFISVEKTKASDTMKELEIQRIAEKQKLFRRLFSEEENLDEAVKVANELVQETHNTFGGNHSVHASALNNLALVEKEVGDYESAIKSYSSAIEIYTFVYGSGHNNTLLTMFNLSQTYKRYAEELEIRKEGARLEREANVLTLYNNALDLLVDVLNGRISIFGENHEEVGATMQLVGALLQSLQIKRAVPNKEIFNKMESIEERSAEFLVRKGAEILESRLGKSSVRVALGWNNLGLFFKRENDLLSAEANYKNSFEILQSLNLPPKNKNMVIVKSNLIELYYAQGKTELAKVLESELFEAVGVIS